MRKWVRRSILGLVLLVVLGIGLGVVLVWLYHGTPAWYQHVHLSAAERARFAQAAENKLIDAQNWAQKIVADTTRRSRHPSTSPASAPVNSHEISFSQSEINALIDKWSTMYGWREEYQKYVDEPQVVLQDGRLILAGKLKELNTIVSFHFTAAIDSDGRLKIDLVNMYAGRLPLPESAWAHWRQPIISGLQQRIPIWQGQARITPGGSANFGAMAVTLSRLVMAVIDHRSADPILFFPLAGAGGENNSVPVRVTQVRIDPGTLTLDVQPLTGAERADLLARIKSSSTNPPAAVH